MANDILAPETLLKKRKSQEKERAVKSAEIDKKKKVKRNSFACTFKTTLMIPTFNTTRPQADAVVLLTIFRI